MRIVLDTNVLVAGMLSPSGTPSRILQAIITGQVTLLYTPAILAEYTDVLPRPKFGFPPEAVATILRFIELQGELVAESSATPALPDKDDEAFLAAAMGGTADRLITGNMAHFPASLRRGVTIMTPAEFARELAERSS